MRRATDSAIRFPRWQMLALVGLMAALGAPGCARLDQFRQKDRPIFGALGPAATKPASGAPNTVDRYAQALKDKRTQSDAATVAGRDAATEPTAAPAESLADLEHDSHDRPGLPVSLEPPVPLDEPAVVAANTEPPPGAWRPRTGPEPSVVPVTATATPRLTGPDTHPRAPSAEQLVGDARGRLDALQTYQVRLRCQERVRGKLLPQEDILLSVRRVPKAVRLQWPDGPHKGREVLYSATDNAGLMLVNMADSPVPVPRLSLPPDSPLAQSNSRHPITEAGFDTILRNLEHAIALEKAGTPTDGKVTYAGLEQPEGLQRGCHKLVRVTPSGETWVVYLDPGTRLPALVQATASDGSLLERYLFLDPRPNVPELAQADAFDANKRWGPPRGLLSRLVRPAAAGATTAAPETVTR
jgi:hypothetical protein